jgi:hypothetical protein
MNKLVRIGLDPCEDASLTIRDVGPLKVSSGRGQASLRCVATAGEPERDDHPGSTFQLDPVTNAIMN